MAMLGFVLLAGIGLFSLVAGIAIALVKTARWVFP